MLKDDLIEAIAFAYSIDLRHLEAVEGGLDTSASAYKGVSSDGDRYFVKVRQDLESSALLSSYLRDVGSPTVLAPIQTRTGEVGHRALDHLILVYPFRAGNNGFEVPLRAAQWREIGTSLRDIHAVKLPASLAEQVPKETFRVQGVEDFEATMKRLLQVAQTPVEDLLAGAIREHQEAIERVLLRTAELGLECAERDWELVPCHADLHAGNVLAEPDGSINLVDWDTARLAPRECDLVFFCGNGIAGHGPDVEAAFFEGYGDYAPELLLLTYYRYARALEDIVSFSREALDPSLDGPDCVRWFRIQFAPRMIVETAEESDAMLTRTRAKTSS